MIRNILYGSPDTRTTPKICRWKIQDIDVKKSEVPPNALCKPDRLDLALQVEDPEIFDPSTYVTAFSGNVDRIHICQSCKPDAVIEIKEPESKSHAYSLHGLLILYTAYFNQEIADKDELYYLFSPNGRS